MSVYYVNKNPQVNGDHEVHKQGCNYMPDDLNKVYLGDYLSCRSAVTKALEFYSKSNGCFHCSEECHTS